MLSILSLNWQGLISYDIYNKGYLLHIIGRIMKSVKIIFLLLFIFGIITTSHAQDLHKGFYGGRFSADYNHSNHVDLGNANEFLFDLSINYGKFVDPFQRRFINSDPNNLRFKPLAVGVKVEFMPKFEFNDIITNNVYNIISNPFCRVYTPFHLFVEFGVGIGYEWWKMSALPIPGTALFNPAGSTLLLYGEGGVGYSFMLTDKVSLEPIVLFKYKRVLESWKSDSRLIIKYGLYPNIGLQFYF
jgi:hypothetical protein